MGEAKRAVDSLWRYAEAKRLVRHDIKGRGEWGGIEQRIGEGATLFFGSICIDLKNPQVITTDEQDHELFEAIFEGRDDAIEMDVNRLNEWREYALNNGRIPRFPEC